MDDTQDISAQQDASLTTGGSTSLPQAASDDQYYHINQQSMAGIQSKINSLPPEANDLDVIEKEWVHHLKEIVLHTREDPYTQQLEISKAKADYLRKRYNKQIKVPEE